ncbi:hypothetical protein CEXT_73581 [Caerostris extrusa]|uniref:Uncharacterized protein n=1 Tax=Caerostris extrusa TaxID=172846 RepID=A0AAV4VZW0_CAEEX|nr:hypothetical protein CEXT_73581 [Caerostris extrusa]
MSAKLPVRLGVVFDNVFQVRCQSTSTTYSPGQGTPNYCIYGGCSSPGYYSIDENCHPLKPISETIYLYAMKYTNVLAEICISSSSWHNNDNPLHCGRFRDSMLQATLPARGTSAIMAGDRWFKEIHCFPRFTEIR